MRGSGYDRMQADERFEGDRYERAPRRGAESNISPEVISETVSEAIAKSNREQLGIIADFFDEAKADRMESERAIIDALSHNKNDEAPAAKVAVPVADAAPIVVDEQNAETLARIERIAGQNAEALNESNEMLERSVNSLRSNTEILNELRNAMGSIASSEQMRQQNPGADFSGIRDEIITAVGDNRAILNMIRQDVLNGFAKNAEEDQEEKIIPLSAEEADKYYKELEDHVHKECVKCYRNVQQALTEQNAEANTGITKSVAGMRIMVLITLLFSVAAVALQVCGILGIL
jgi:predicted transcriptional regulator